jgi:hypothetical protein
MKNAWSWASMVVLSAAACGSNPPSQSDRGEDAGSDASLPFEECLAKNGWSPPAAPAAWSSRDLAVRIAAVQARCQPSDDMLDGYVKRLTGP